MNILNSRQKKILKLLASEGQVQVEKLATSFGVVNQTIRRDLAELCNKGLADRIHGGARKLISTSMVAYESRRQANVSAKISIANSTASLIPNGSSVAINIGTTTEQVANALRQHNELTVISNNINIVHIMQTSKVKSLIVVGGQVRLSDGAIVGSSAEEAFRNYKVDFAIIGASSLDSDGSILDFDQREVVVAQSILNNSRNRILVCCNSKFSISAPHRICNVRDLDIFVTDSPPPIDFQKIAQIANTRIIISKD